MDGKPVKSCTVLAAMCEGHEIRTVESLEVERPARPDPAGLPRAPRAPVRLLHAGDADDRARAAGREPRSRPSRRSAPRSPERSAAARVTRTSSAAVRWAAEHEAATSADRRSEHGRRREPSEPLDRAPDRLRPPEAQGGRALHPRQGHLPRRHRAAGDGARRRAAQPVRPRAHRLDRHLARAGASQRRRRRHRQGPRDARPGVDADDLLRHAGRPRRRQGPLPGPGGRVRDRDRRVLGQRRARADRRRVRAAAGGRQRAQGARPRRAADPRRQGRPARQHSPARPGRPATRRPPTAPSPRPTRS